MSDTNDRAENFVQRWARLKRAANTSKLEIEFATNDVSANATWPQNPSVDPKIEHPMFDPASLPPIESINATSDIRAFLAPGVPAELSRAALRRAWLTDPIIRDFVGIAENQWDFNAPDGVPGFGPLQLTPEFRRALIEMVGNADRSQIRHQDEAQKTVDTRGAAGKKSDDAPVRPPDSRADSGRSGDISQRQTRSAPPPMDAAAQNGECSAPDGAGAERRKHGGALPK